MTGGETMRLGVAKLKQEKSVMIRISIYNLMNGWTEVINKSCPDKMYVSRQDSVSPRPTAGSSPRYADIRKIIGLLLSSSAPGEGLCSGH